MRSRIWVMWLLGVIAMAAAAAVIVVVAASNTETADKGVRKADRALARTRMLEQRQLQDQAFEAGLAREKICSDSHPEYCQQLWDRLLRYTTKKQGLQAACDLLAQLHRQGLVNRLRRRSGCPPPTPAYRPRR